MDEFFNENKIEVQEIIPLPHSVADITLHVARLDRIHPIISGNKLFKLYYFLREAHQKNIGTIVTFGGAYSNHLVATAFACQAKGLRSIGIVRGEKPNNLSHTLLNCEKYGMELQFVPRDEYQHKSSPPNWGSLTSLYEPCILIPEGGYHPFGASGAGLIMNIPEIKSATHVCTPVGTATTLAGLLFRCKLHQRIIGIPVLKNMTDIHDRINFLQTGKNIDQLTLFSEYHFGGYAKYSGELIHFMNELYKSSGLPTDFVYTAKMMFAIFDQIQRGFFPAGSNIICLHTGGLQGNLSLSPGTLVF